MSSHLESTSLLLVSSGEPVDLSSLPTPTRTVGATREYEYTGIQTYMNNRYSTKHVYYRHR